MRYYYDPLVYITFHIFPKTINYVPQFKRQLHTNLAQTPCFCFKFYKIIFPLKRLHVSRRCFTTNKFERVRSYAINGASVVPNTEV